MWRRLLLLVAPACALGGFDTTQCQSSRACFLVPPNCAVSRSLANCTAAFSFSLLPNSAGFDFLLVGTTRDLVGQTLLPHYVAIGFSLDQHMGDDTVIACIGNADRGLVSLSWNDKTKSYLARDISPFILSNTSFAAIDGDLRCSGRFRFHTNVSSRVLDLANPAVAVHLLLARGDVDPYSYDLSYHATIDGSAFPWISSESFSFCQSTSACTATGTSALLQKAHQSAVPRTVKHLVALGHAVVMLSAWWCLVAPGILTARYLKPERGSCWFYTHAVLMLLAFVLVSTAFFAIFYQAEWRVYGCSTTCIFEDYQKAVHAAMGIVAYTCICLQILTGLTRPSPQVPRRICFNWFHTCCGVLAFAAASTCIVTGNFVGKTGLDTIGVWPRHTMTVVLCAFVVVCILCEISGRRRKYKPEENTPTASTKVDKHDSTKTKISSIALIFVIAYETIAILGVALLAYWLFQVTFTRLNIPLSLNWTII